MKMEEDTRKCPKCGNTNIITDTENGERVCSTCGLVIEETPIDMGPEWRAFTVAEKNTRSRTGLGSSLTLYDKGLSTVFKGDRDASGRKLNNEARLKMDRLRRYDNRSKFDETWRRNLSIAMAELDRMSVILHIPSNIKEQAALIYRKALKADLIRGRSIDAFVAASIYAACRAAEVPRPIKKVSRQHERPFRGRENIPPAHQGTQDTHARRRTHEVHPKHRSEAQPQTGHRAEGGGYPKVGEDQAGIIWQGPSWTRGGGSLYGLHRERR